MSNFMAFSGCFSHVGGRWPSQWQDSRCELPTVLNDRSQTPQTRALSVQMGFSLLKIDAAGGEEELGTPHGFIVGP